MGRGGFATTTVTAAVFTNWEQSVCVGWVDDDNGDGNGLTNGEPSARLMKTTAMGAV